MVKIKEIISYLESWVPLSFQDSYDNAGLQAGNTNQDFKSGIICLDVRPEIIEEALSTGANFILSHHPVLFHPLKCVSGQNLSEQIIISAIQHNLVIYSMHTNLDNVMDGVNASFSKRLKLQNLKILHPQSISESEVPVGAGMVGELAKPMQESEFLGFVKGQLELKVLRHSKSLQKPIRKVAVCGGAGAFLLPDALASKANAFVVGEAHYHDFIDYENRIMIIEVGHYESEHWIKYDLLNKLNEKFSTFAVAKSEHSTYNYL